MPSPPSPPSPPSRRSSRINDVLIWLKEALNIRDGEGRRVVGLALYLLLAVSTFISGRIQRDSLFLSAFSKEDLASMYISVAVMVPVPALLFARIADRFRRDKLLVWTLLTTVVLMGFMRLLLTLQQRWVYVVLYNFVEVYGTFLILQFWTFAGDLFSSREAKRLFPIVSSGSVIAGIVCGLAVSGLVKAIGTENLLVLQMVLLLGGAAVIRSMGRTERARLRHVAVLDAVRGKRGTQQQGLKVSQQASNIFQSKHLKIVAGMTVATFVTVPLIDYQFKVLVKEHFTHAGLADTDAISAFMGLFSAVTGIMAAVMQLALTGRILERFGVVAALLLLPVTLLGGLFAMVSSLASAFMCAVFTKGAENSFRYSITDATMQVLYTPVPSQARGRAKTFIDGVIKPMAGGLAGAAMVVLVGPLRLPLTSLAVVAAVLVACWIGLILLIRREYVKELLSTLRRRRLDFSDQGLTINDAPTVALLRSRLRGNDDTDILNSIELCRRVQGHDLSTELVSLLDHDDATVRRASLELIGDRRGGERVATIDPARVERLFAVGHHADVDDDVRAAAVAAYCAIVGDQAIGAVEPMLRSTSPSVRGAAVAGIIRYGGFEGILHAAADLKAMLADEDETMRFACARVLEDIAVKGFHGPVQALLGDRSLRVQLAAIAAAGAMKSPELMARLIQQLSQRELGRAAQAALAAYGDDVIVALVRVVLQPHEDLHIRKSIPRVLERIGTASALNALVSALLTVDEPAVRRELARACARVRDRLGVAVDEVAIRRVVAIELQRHYQLLAMMADLAPVTQDARRDLLRDALEVRAQHSLEGIFRLLGIIHPHKAIETIWGNLRSTSSVARANAIEVLDNVLLGDEKRALLPVLEAGFELAAEQAVARRALDRVLERGDELYPLVRHQPEVWLGQLLEGSDPWLVVCALHAVTELGLPGATAVVIGHLQSQHPIVRETALSALRVLVPAPEFVHHCEIMAHDSHSAVNSTAAKLRAVAHTVT